MINHT